jgi:hypothetical protein
MFSLHIEKVEKIALFLNPDSGCDTRTDSASREHRITLTHVAPSTDRIVFLG